MATGNFFRLKPDMEIEMYRLYPTRADHVKGLTYKLAWRLLLPIVIIVLYIMFTHPDFLVIPSLQYFVGNPYGHKGGV